MRRSGSADPEAGATPPSVTSSSKPVSVGPHAPPRLSWIACARFVQVGDQWRSCAASTSAVDPPLSCSGVTTQRQCDGTWPASLMRRQLELVFPPLVGFRLSPRCDLETVKLRDFAIVKSRFFESASSRRFKGFVTLLACTSGFDSSSPTPIRFSHTLRITLSSLLGLDDLQT